MSENFKRLTGKNPKDFEPVAFSLVNKPDVDLFAELVRNDDFLFDFVKQNVEARLAKVCNEKNYLNLIQFLKFYSPSYEKFIVSTLAKFADEDLTDKMLDIFENGSVDEKTYCAKFFSFIQDPLAIEFLKQNAYSEFPCLSANCASTLALLGEKTCYQDALNKLNSEDEFEKLDAVRFLVSYGNKDSVSKIIEVMKSSSLAENIAGELLYLTDLFSLFNNNQNDALLTLNSVINGLGEILGLAQVFDFQIYEFLEFLMKQNLNSEIAVVLLNAKDKFDTLTENDEYLFDEAKDIKQEVLDINKLLKSLDKNVLKNFVNEELKTESLFVFTALELSDDADKIRTLLSSSNQTVILKALEVLKKMNFITAQDKESALNAVSNENIKSIIMAI